MVNAGNNTLYLTCNYNGIIESISSIAKDWKDPRQPPPLLVSCQCGSRLGLLVLYIISRKSRRLRRRSRRALYPSESLRHTSAPSPAGKLGPRDGPLGEAGHARPVNLVEVTFVEAGKARAVDLVEVALLVEAREARAVDLVEIALVEAGESRAIYLVEIALVETGESRAIYLVEVALVEARET